MHLVTNTQMVNGLFIELYGLPLWGQSDTTDIKTISQRALHAQDSLKSAGNTLKSLRSDIVDSLKNLKHVDRGALTPSEIFIARENRDSLNRLTEKFNRLDSLKGKSREVLSSRNLDSAKAISDTKVNGVVDSLNNKISNVRSRTGTVIDNIQKRAVGRVGDQKNVSLPVDNVPGDIGLPSHEMSGIGIQPVPVVNDLPAMQFSGTDAVNLPSDAINVNTDIPNTSVPELPGLEKVNDITSKTKELDGNIEKVGQYQKDAKDLKSNAPEKLEELPESRYYNQTQIL